MEIKWLEDFLCLVETRNFSRAATLRYVTQPAFSRRIKLLEDWLGAELVDRNTFPTVLTPEGRIFRGVAEETLRMLGNARDEIRDEQRRRQAVLSIAALHTLAVTSYPALHRNLVEWFDDLTSKVRALDFTHCMEALSEGACDLFLSYGHADVPVLLDPTDFPHLLLGEDVFVPVSVPGPRGRPAFAWPGTKRTRVSLMSFAPNCYLGKIQDRFVKRCAPVDYFDVVYENSMSEAVKAMILAGNGMGWLPRALVAAELDDGRLVQAGADDWTTVLEIRLYRHQRPGRDIVERVWGALDERNAA